MCKATSDGGQRCAAHARVHLDARAHALQQAQATGKGRDVAYRAWEDAAVEYASTPTGRAEFEDVLTQARQSGDVQSEAAIGVILRRGDDLRLSNQATADALQTARGTTGAPASVNGVSQRRPSARRASASEHVRDRLRALGEALPEDFEVRTLRTGSSGRVTGTWSWMGYSPIEGSLNFGSHYPATELLRCHNWRVPQSGAEWSHLHPITDRSIDPCEHCQHSDRIGCRSAD